MDACSVPVGAPGKGGGVGDGGGRSRSVCWLRIQGSLQGRVLGRWMAQTGIDDGTREGLTTGERRSLGRLRKENWVSKEG